MALRGFIAVSVNYDCDFSVLPVHPTLPIVYSSGKNERERLVTEVGREGGKGRREGEGQRGERGRAEMHKKTIHRAAK